MEGADKFNELWRHPLDPLVVTQLAEWLLPLPEVRASNPVICKFYAENDLLLTVKKTKIKKTRGRNWPI